MKLDGLIIDNFAGGGGASTGIEMALGRSPDYAINHDPEALAMHKANHPGTEHLCENVWAVDIKKLVAGRKVALCWFSPDCKHFSKAKGGKPVEKKIRGLAWVALRWAGIAKPAVIILENVEEFQTWGPIVNGKPCLRRKGMTFKRWVTQLRNLGYEVEWKERRACWDGAPTSRKRLFVVARRDGKPIVWPEATHGKGRLPYRTAADCIDWSLPCPSIFLTKEEGDKIGVKRPLAEKTMQRIAAGIERFVMNGEPFIVSLTHQGGDRNESINEPLKTVTGAKRGDDKPYHSVLAENHTGLDTAFMTKFYGAKREGDDRANLPDPPVATIPTENRHGLVTSHIIKMRGTNIGSGTDEPIQTLSAGGTHMGEVRAFLLKYYGTQQRADLKKPIDAIPTRDRFALGIVTIAGEPWQIVDIGLRMLTPRELFRAQGFPDSYIIDHGVEITGQADTFTLFSVPTLLSKTAQVRMVGNSVSPQCAAALVRAQFGVEKIRKAV